MSTRVRSVDVVGFIKNPHTSGIVLSSLTRVLSSALGFSPYPPVSVCGTGTSWTTTRDFSWKLCIDPLTCRSETSSSASPLGSNLAFVARSLLPNQPTGLHRHPIAGGPSILRPPSSSNISQSGIEILIYLPSTTPFGLVLGPD